MGECVRACVHTRDTAPCASTCAYARRESETEGREILAENGSERRCTRACTQVSTQVRTQVSTREQPRHVLDARSHAPHARKNARETPPRGPIGGFAIRWETYTWSVFISRWDSKCAYTRYFLCTLLWSFVGTFATRAIPLVSRSDDSGVVSLERILW